jgi:5-methylcytosine-specific restriction protein A
MNNWGQGRGGRPWRRKRERILERDKYLCKCTECIKNNLLTPADEVDHIIPISQGGSDDDSNLAAINHECHKRKTAAEHPAMQFRNGHRGNMQRKAARVRMLQPRLAKDGGA